MGFVSVLVFILIGVGGGLLLARRYPGASQLASIMLGIGGALLISWLLQRLGLGLGFMAFSLWGIIGSALGALLAPLAYCLLNARYRTKIESA